MSEAEKLLQSFDDCGIDYNLLMAEAFLGYKYRKSKGTLYSSDVSIPVNLIKWYYTVHFNLVEFDKLKKAFVTRYVNNESKIEQVDEDYIIEGLREMYEYIHSEDIEYMFDIYTIKDLHRKLFSKTPFPEYAGDFRKNFAHLKGTTTEICDWTMIRPNLEILDEEVQRLRKASKLIRSACDTNALIKYLGDCVVLGCKIIKVHPFVDGNKRTTRGFINKLLEDAGLPPVYIKANERDEYLLALSKAHNEENYTDIKNFYLYKVCDSIIELDINERVRKNKEDKRKSEEESVVVKKIGTYPDNK